MSDRRAGSGVRSPAPAPRDLALAVVGDVSWRHGVNLKQAIYAALLLALDAPGTALTVTLDVGAAGGWSPRALDELKAATLELQQRGGTLVITHASDAQREQLHAFGHVFSILAGDAPARAGVPPQISLPV